MPFRVEWFECTFQLLQTTRASVNLVKMGINFTCGNVGAHKTANRMSLVGMN